MGNPSSLVVAGLSRFYYPRNPSMMIRCLRLMLLVLSAQVAVAQPIHNPLTNAIDVLSLPVDQAADGMEVLMTDSKAGRSPSNRVFVRRDADPRSWPAKVLRMPRRAGSERNA